MDTLFGFGSSDLSPCCMVVVCALLRGLDVCYSVRVCFLHSSFRRHAFYRDLRKVMVHDLTACTYGSDM